MNFIENNFALSKISLDINILAEFNLDVVELVPNGLAFNKKKAMKEKVLFGVKGIEDISKSKDIALMYSSELLYNTGKLRSLSPDNFIINQDCTTLASKDFRTIVKDYKGNVPRDVMLNCASVALLSLSGLIDLTIGYDYIRSMMSKYGQVNFEYQFSGYLIISSGNPEPKINFKAETKMTKGSGGSSPL